MKTCNECNNKHYAKGKCKFHYKMPSQINPISLNRGTPIGNFYMKRVVKMVQSDHSDDKTNKPIKTPKTIKVDLSLPELKKLAVIVFNRAIRKRDAIGGTYFKCISCGNLSMIDFADCGHYMPSTYSQLKFEPLNCHAECQQCNRHDKDHLIGYRENLINKIGRRQVDWLESHKMGTEHKWTREELQDIIDKYK